MCLLLAAGCGAAGDGGAAAPSFDGAPTETFASTSGALAVGVRWSPHPPTVGLDAAELEISDANQGPVSGLSLVVVPWMPAHGHGTSTKPTIAETAPGVYLLTQLNLFMPGEWQLRTTISGPLDDTVNPTTEVH